MASRRTRPISTSSGGGGNINLYVVLLVAVGFGVAAGETGTHSVGALSVIRSAEITAADAVQRAVTASERIDQLEQRVSVLEGKFHGSALPRRRGHKPAATVELPAKPSVQMEGHTGKLSASGTKSKPGVLALVTTNGTTQSSYHDITLLLLVRVLLYSRTPLVSCLIRECYANAHMLAYRQPLYELANAHLLQVSASGRQDTHVCYSSAGVVLRVCYLFATSCLISNIFGTALIIVMRVVQELPSPGRQAGQHLVTSCINISPNTSPQSEQPSRFETKLTRASDPSRATSAAFKRLLHRASDDELMHEVPTVRIPSEHPDCDVWCTYPVADRGPALLKFLQVMTRILSPC
eukprot:1184771-Prorocentrum_minimum.AAC.3